MAHFSEKREQEAKAAKIAARLEERSELFKKFRATGWEIGVLNPSTPLTASPKTLSDNWPDECHYWVKMPGAAGMRIKSITAIYRLAKGVAA